MFSDNIKKIVLNDAEYPYICDMVVLERIQEKYTDLIAVEDGLRGFVPRVDADGVIDRTVGNYTIPRIGMVCDILSWMIAEGLDITGSEAAAPSPTDLKRSGYGITEMAAIVFEEFELAIVGQKKIEKPIATT